jgi:hypothetical protein
MGFQFMDFTRRVGEQTLALYALEKVGMNRMINREDNLFGRNLMRGGVWYLSNEMIEQALTGRSNLTEMDLKTFVDDVAFNAVASTAIEQSGVFNVFGNLVDSTVNISPEINDILATALIVETVNVFGKQVEDMAIKNVSKLLGL